MQLRWLLSRHAGLALTATAARPTTTHSTRVSFRVGVGVRVRVRVRVGRKDRQETRQETSRQEIQARVVGRHYRPADNQVAWNQELRVLPLTCTHLPRNLNT